MMNSNLTRAHVYLSLFTDEQINEMMRLVNKNGLSAVAESRRLVAPYGLALPMFSALPSSSSDVQLPPEEIAMAVCGFKAMFWHMFMTQPAPGDYAGALSDVTGMDVGDALTLANERIVTKDTKLMSTVNKITSYLPDFIGGAASVLGGLAVSGLERLLPMWLFNYSNDVLVEIRNLGEVIRDAIRSNAWRSSEMALEAAAASAGKNQVEGGSSFLGTLAPMLTATALGLTGAGAGGKLGGTALRGVMRALSVGGGAAAAGGAIVPRGDVSFENGDLELGDIFHEGGDYVDDFDPDSVWDGTIVLPELGDVLAYGDVDMDEFDPELSYHTRSQAARLLSELPAQVRRLRTGEVGDFWGDVGNFLTDASSEIITGAASVAGSLLGPAGTVLVGAGGKALGDAVEGALRGARGAPRAVARAKKVRAPKHGSVAPKHAPATVKHLGKKGADAAVLLGTKPAVMSRSGVNRDALARVAVLLGEKRGNVTIDEILRAVR